MEPLNSSSVVVGEGHLVIRLPHKPAFTSGRWAHVIPEGDETLRIEFLPTELKLSEAALILGIGRGPLLDVLKYSYPDGRPLIRSRTPYGSQVWLETASVFEHREATRDFKFWEKLGYKLSRAKGGSSRPVAPRVSVPGTGVATVV